MFIVSRAVISAGRSPRSRKHPDALSMLRAAAKEMQFCTETCKWQASTKHGYVQDKYEKGSEYVGQDKSKEAVESSRKALGHGKKCSERWAFKGRNGHQDMGGTLWAPECVLMGRSLEASC